MHARIDPTPGLSFILALAVMLPLLNSQRLVEAAEAAAVPSQAPATRLPSAKEVLTRFVKAIGGADAVHKLNSSHSIGKVEAAKQAMTGTLEVFSARPNKLLQKMSIAGIESTVGYNGEVGWSIDPMQGPMLLQGKMLEEVREQADFYGILHDPKNYKSMETVQRTQFDNKDCYKLKLVRLSGNETTEYFDTKTGLLVGVVGMHESPMGAASATATVGNYKEFDGVKIPTRVSQQMMGVEMVVIVTSCENNQVSDSVFDLPPQIRALVVKQATNPPATK